ncbi:NAD(P)/FAD-dependent oxidoreductase [Leucobacter chromiireducens]|uniref:NAD(P)/FAD-dependent oxidoreductase n=1 Tax=Leucobacter chromiireducens TaxID=283877 RepID=UPI000F63E416|nr:NAD(P)/FAD-dependent oxidoreductase [Leucobacter chromiireducens]
MTEHTSDAHASYDAVILGGGAAGLSAAQTLGRSLRSTLVIDGGLPRNRFAAHMHNVLGHDGTPPQELLARGRAEAEAYGVEFAAGEVTAVREGAAGVIVEASVAGEPRTVTARALLLAAGADDELPEVPGLADHWGGTVLHCPYCHGWEVRGGRLGVLTTSPASIHQALLARQWSDRVTVFAAGLGELEPGIERRLRSRGVEIVHEPVVEVLGEAAGITGVRTDDGRVHPLDAMLTASTVRPRDAAVAPLALERAETPVGSFIAVDPMGRTSHPRVWAAGNVVAPMATVPVAMGAAAMAGGAMNWALVEEDFVTVSMEN